jgi:hypothetical protein
MGLVRICTLKLTWTFWIVLIDYYLFDEVGFYFIKIYFFIFLNYFDVLILKNIFKK